MGVILLRPQLHPSQKNLNKNVVKIIKLWYIKIVKGGDFFGNNKST